MGRRLSILIIALAILSSLLVFAGRSSLAQATFTVNSTADTDDGSCDPLATGDCTLREAVDAANASPGPDTINFSVSGTISLTAPAPPPFGGTLFLEDAGTTIDATGQTITVDASGAGSGAPGFEVLTSSATFKGFTVENARGAGIRADGEGHGGSYIPAPPPVDCPGVISTLVLTGMTIRNNNQDHHGQGGVYVCGAEVRGLSVSGTTIADNVAALWVTSGQGDLLLSDVSIADSQISSSAAPVPDPDDAIRFNADGGSASITGVSVTKSTITAAPGTGGRALVIGGFFEEPLDHISGVVVSGNTIDGNVTIGGPKTTNNDISVSGNASLSGTGFGPGSESAVFIAGQSNTAISVDDNLSVTSGIGGFGVAIPGGPGTSSSGISVSGNTFISGEDHGVLISTDSNTDISIDNNTSISGLDGVAIAGDSNSDISVSGNGEITATGPPIGGPPVHEAVRISGRMNSDISINDNGSLTGAFSVILTGFGDFGTSESNTRVSVSGNGTITASDTWAFAVGVFGATNNGVSVDENGAILGGVGPGSVGIKIGNGDASGENFDVSVSGNGSIEGNVFGVDIGTAAEGLITSNTRVSVDENTAIWGGNMGVIIGHGDPSTNSDVSISGNLEIGGGFNAITIFGASTNNVSINNNAQINGGDGGVGIQGASISNVSVNANGPITTGFGGVGIEGLSLNSISVSGNASISGTGGFGVLVGGGGCCGGGPVVVDAVTINDNGPITGGIEGVNLPGDTVTNISIGNNASVTGGTNAVAILGASIGAVSIDNNTSISGGVSGIAIVGSVVSFSATNVEINNNETISGGPTGTGIGISGEQGIVSNMSVSGNGEISGGHGIIIGGPHASFSNTNIAISDNDDIRGDTFHGVAIFGATNSNVFVSGNTSISGAGEFGLLICCEGDVSDVSVHDNGSISGAVEGGITIISFGATNSNVSISDNGTIHGGRFGVKIGGGTVSNISIGNNASVNGGNSGINITSGASISNVSVDNNGSVIGDDDSGVFISNGPDVSVSVSNVSVSGNDHISGGHIGVFVGVQADVTDVAVDNNAEITGGFTGVGVGGDTITNISIDNNGSVTGTGAVPDIRSYGILIGGQLPVPIPPPPGPPPGSTSAISNVSVSGNDGISGSDIGVSINGGNNRNVLISDNASISSGNEEAVGIGGDSNRHVFVIGNGINAGQLGIAISGDNPGWLYNVVAGNVVESGPGSLAGILLFASNRTLVVDNAVQASTSDAAFGIVLVASDRNLVAFNRVEGFTGEIEIDPGPPPILVGGGIGVILESSRNLILANVVDSEPDLFWDETGSRNRWFLNQCDTSQPEGLCW